MGENKKQVKTFHLNLKKCWFEMILAGIKKEEYRDVSKYWKPRFERIRELGIKTITFSNGYAKNRRQMIVELNYIKIGKGITEWGAIYNKIYFVSMLGKVISHSG